MNTEHQRPEGALILAAAKRLHLGARPAAARTGMSEARWRQIVNGYQSVGAGQVAEVRGPADTIARMARAVGLTSDDLRSVHREDAAQVLDMLDEDEIGLPTAVDRLAGLRDELSVIINELRSTEGACPHV